MKGPIPRFHKEKPRDHLGDEFFLSLHILPNGLNKMNYFIVSSISNNYLYATYSRYFIQRGHNYYCLDVIISPVSVLVDIRFLLRENVFG